MVKTPARILLVAAALTIGAALPVLAQSSGSSSSGTAGSSSSAGAPGASTPTPSSPAPSGGTSTGRSAAGEETPTQRQELDKMKKDTTICKGC